MEVLARQTSNIVRDNGFQVLDEDQACARLNQFGRFGVMRHVCLIQTGVNVISEHILSRLGRHPSNYVLIRLVELPEHTDSRMVFPDTEVVYNDLTNYCWLEFITFPEDA
jgi:hypothetical protein